MDQVNIVPGGPYSNYATGWRVWEMVDLVYLGVPGEPFNKGLVGYKSLRSGVIDCSGGPDATKDL